MHGFRKLLPARATNQQRLKLYLDLERKVRTVVGRLESDAILFIIYSGHGSLTKEGFTNIALSPGCNFQLEPQVISAAAPLLVFQVLPRH